MLYTGFLFYCLLFLPRIVMSAILLRPPPSPPLQMSLQHARPVIIRNNQDRRVALTQAVIQVVVEMPQQQSYLLLPNMLEKRRTIYRPLIEPRWWQLLTAESVDEVVSYCSTWYRMPMASLIYHEHSPSCLRVEFSFLLLSTIEQYL